MDPKYINPFLLATKRIFETMISIPYSLGEPVMKKDNAVPHEISSIVGLSGNVSGCVVISLSRAVAFQLVSALIGEELDDINEVCTDAIGEIANMIAGNAKNGFPRGNNAISVPSVVVGKHKVNYPSGIPIVTIPCTTDRGEMVIEVALKADFK